MEKPLGWWFTYSAFLYFTKALTDTSRIHTFTRIHTLVAEDTLHCPPALPLSWPDLLDLELRYWETWDTAGWDWTTDISIHGLPHYSWAIVACISAVNSSQKMRCWSKNIIVLSFMCNLPLKESPMAKRSKVKGETEGQWRRPMMSNNSKNLCNHPRVLRSQTRGRGWPVSSW